MPRFCVAELLAHHPDVDEVATLRWQEWRHEPGATSVAHWLDVTRRECRVSATGQVAVPLTLVAHDSGGLVVGAVGLAAQDPEGMVDRGPWVVGMVVRAELRGSGIGRGLLAALHERAVLVDRLWVTTRHAAGFYLGCGYVRLPGSRTMLYRNIAS